jgi:hypothetical protein
MTNGDKRLDKREQLLQFAAGKHALRATDAAGYLSIPVAAATRLLDELVEEGVAERLRPIGCDHSRYDHYRLQRPSAADHRSFVISHSSMVNGNRPIATQRHYPMSKGCWRTATANTNNQHPMTAARWPNDQLCGTLPRVRLPLLRWVAAWLAAVLSVFLFVVHVAAGEPTEAREDLETLDGLVERWMTLRTTIAEEKREWKARREQWEDEIALLEQEARTLKKEIDEGDTFASSVEKKRAEALARKERMESELGKLRAVLDRAEADLRRWRERIPPGLMASSAAGFEALPATQKEAEKLPLTKRAQTVAALYTQIETLQNRFHATRETLDVNGKRRKVDVLYVGLARAFAVSPGNDWAAIGTPSNTAWTWTPAIHDAEVVRRAIDVLNREETAQLVALPIQVAEEVER